MRYTGRRGWQVTRKDTWGLYSTMQPMILAGLKKFLEVVSEADTCAGVPGAMEEFGELDENFCYKDFDGAMAKWHETIEKMIYAFDPSNEPDTKDYNYEFVEGPNNGKEDEQGYIEVDFGPDNQEEWDRYTSDLRTYNKRVQEGYELFGKYYQNLWW